MSSTEDALEVELAAGPPVSQLRFRAANLGLSCAPVWLRPSHDPADLSVLSHQKLLRCCFPSRCALRP